MIAQWDASTRVSRGLLFTVGSVLGTGVDFVLFNVLLLFASAGAIQAATVGYAAGFVASFLFAREIVFSGRALKRLARSGGVIRGNLPGCLLLSNGAVALVGTVGPNRNALLLNVVRLAAGLLIWSVKFILADAVIFSRRSRLE